MHKPVCIHVTDGWTKVRDRCQLPSSTSFHLFQEDLSVVLIFLQTGQLASGTCLSPVPSIGFIGKFPQTQLVCWCLGYTPRFSYLSRKQYTQQIHIPFFIKPNQTKQTTKIGYVRQKSKSQIWKFNPSCFNIESYKMLKSLLRRRKDTCSKGMVKSQQTTAERSTSGLS